MADFDWKQIAGPLINIGATTLGTVIGGPAGGAVGKAAGSILAQTLGVPATPEAVAGAIAANPEAARQVEMTPEMMAAIANAQAEQIKEINQTMRLELAADDRFVRWGRPFWMWSGGVVFGMQGLAISFAMFTRQFDILKAVPDLTPFWFVFGGVVGIYAWGRTAEKVAVEKYGAR